MVFIRGKKNTICSEVLGWGAKQKHKNYFLRSWAGGGGLKPKNFEKTKTHFLSEALGWGGGPKLNKPLKKTKKQQTIFCEVLGWGEVKPKNLRNNCNLYIYIYIYFVF